MSLTFRPTPFDARFLPPKDEVLPLLGAKDFDANGDVRELIYQEGTFLLDNGILFTEDNVIAIDLTFDQLGGVQISYSVGSDVFLYWFDPQQGAYTKTFISEGAEPKVYWTERNGEVTSQVIYSYRKGKKVYYRSQLDRYLVEYEVPMKGVVTDDVDFLVGAATTVDNTFLFRGRNLPYGQGTAKIVASSRNFSFGLDMITVASGRPV